MLSHIAGSGRSRQNIVQTQRLRMGLLAIALGFLVALPAAAATSVAVFGFDLVNTSPAPSTQVELDRLAKLGRDLGTALQKSGRYQLVDIAPARAKLAGQPPVQDCNGCERPIALSLGAKLAAFGWVQKVSNLILNLNLIIEDAETGRRLAAGSVDMRGNTDESWDRGLKYLLEEHVFQN